MPTVVLVDALLARGDALAADDDLSEAIGHFSEALRLAPKQLSVSKRLCHALLLAGRPSEAAACVAHTMRILGGAHDAWFFHSLQGEIHTLTGEHARAAKSYAKARELRPTDAGLHYNEGAAWRQAGRADKATAALHFSIRLAPQDADAYTELASAQELTLFSSSVDARAAAARLAPSKATAALDFGHSLLAAGRAAEAHEAYRVAITLDPLSAIPRFALGQALCSLRRHDEAYQVLSAASRLAPADADLPHACGVAAWVSGRRDEARRQWARAAAIQPTRSDSLSLLRWSTHGRTERGAPTGYAKPETPAHEGERRAASVAAFTLAAPAEIGDTCAATAGHRAAGGQADRHTGESARAWVSRASHLLSVHGVLLLTGVLNASTAAALHAAVVQAASGHGPAGSYQHDTTSSTFENHRRLHVAIPLRHPPVAAALSSASAVLFPLLANVMGVSAQQPARILESGVLLSRPGAPAQRTHADTDQAEVGGPFLKVQFGSAAIHEVMGPIEVAPGTHWSIRRGSRHGLRVPASTREREGGHVVDGGGDENMKGSRSQARHVKAARDDVLEEADAEEVPLLPVALPAGALLVYDSSILHRGGANRSRKNRFVFYITLARPTGGLLTGGWDDGDGGVRVSTQARASWAATAEDGLDACCPLGLPYTIQPEEAGCMLLDGDGLRLRQGCTRGVLDDVHSQQ